MKKRAKRQTLDEVLAEIAKPGRLQNVCTLDGLPIGAWPDTQQIIRQLDDALPIRAERAYTLGELIAALYDTSGTHYVRRAPDDVGKRTT